MKFRIFLSDVVFSPMVICLMISSVYLSFWFITELILGKSNTPGIDGGLFILLGLIGYAIILFLNFAAFFIPSIEEVKGYSPAIICILLIVAFVSQVSGFYSVMEAIIVLLIFFCFLSFMAYLFAKNDTMSYVVFTITGGLSLIYLITHFSNIRLFLDSLVLVTI